MPPPPAGLPAGARTPVQFARSMHRCPHVLLTDLVHSPDCPPCRPPWPRAQQKGQSLASRLWCRAHLSVLGEHCWAGGSAAGTVAVEGTLCGPGEPLWEADAHPMYHLLPSPVAGCQEATAPPCPKLRVIRKSDPPVKTHRPNPTTLRFRSEREGPLSRDKRYPSPGIQDKAFQLPRAEPAGAPLGPRSALRHRASA